MRPAMSPDPLARPWRSLSGLAISGFLMALPGGLLPLWGYHIRPAFGTAGNYFAVLGIGMAAAAAAALKWRGRWPVERLLAAGCGGAALALLLLAFASPPMPVWFQMLGLLVAGAAAGVVNTAVFESLANAWDAGPARVALTAGIFFGSGSVLAAWLMSRSVESPDSPLQMALPAVLPAAAAVVLGRIPLAAGGKAPLPFSAAVSDLRSVLAIMFALLLFFQFANEWSIAGWLPVYLIDRLGMSPVTAVSILTLYWMSLTAGRVVAARLLPRVRHGRLLATSALCAFFGCVFLWKAATTAGVIIGVLLIGAGFSAIYPLAAERISTRFSYYHPGYFNGIFTFAMLGGLLAPFVFGYLAAEEGLWLLPVAAIFGSCAVVALLLLIWLGRKVSGT